MSKNGSKKQGLTSAILISLLFVSGCSLVIELFIEETPTETPIQAPTATPAPTITPTLYWPPEIAAKFDEELPELGSNDVIEVDGVFMEVKDWKLVEIEIPDQISTKFDETAFYDKTAGGSLRISDSLYTAVYKDGEWQFDPKFYTSFESGFLKATLEKYFGKEGTPNPIEEALQLLKSNPNYTSKISFINFHGDNPPPTFFQNFFAFCRNGIYINGRTTRCSDRGFGVGWGVDQSSFS